MQFGFQSMCLSIDDVASIPQIQLHPVDYVLLDSPKNAMMIAYNHNKSYAMKLKYNCIPLLLSIPSDTVGCCKNPLFVYDCSTTKYISPVQILQRRHPIHKITIQTAYKKD